MDGRIRSCLDRRSDRPVQRHEPDVARAVYRGTATAVGGTGYQRDLQHRLEVVSGDANPTLRSATRRAGGRVRPRHGCPVRRHRAARRRLRDSTQPNQPATDRRLPAMRLEAALPPGTFSRNHRGTAQPGTRMPFPTLPDAICLALAIVQILTSIFGVLRHRVCRADTGGRL
jgi:hypothetical protein